MNLTTYKISSISLILSILLSCSKSPNNTKEILSAANFELNLSKKHIESNSAFLYKALNSRLTDPKAKEKATYWYPRSEKVRTIANEIDAYIENLKVGILTKAGLKNTSDLVNVNDIFSTRKFLSSEIPTLFAKLKQSELDFLKVDESIALNFTNTIDLTGFYQSSVDSKLNRISETSFKNTNALSAICLLNIFQNRIRITEYELTYFCYNSSIFVGCGYASGPRLIVSQSSTIVKPNETIAITAGIGNFFNEFNPVFLINSIEIPIDPIGVAKKTIKAPSKAGKYTVPVTATYTKLDGTKESNTYNVTFEVVNVPE